MKIRLLSWALATAAVPLFGQGPSWWTEPETLIWDGLSTDNYAPVNVGQLKHVASMAKKYMDRELGFTHYPLIWDEAYTSHGGNPFPFSPGSSGENGALANVGQLKYLASGFYEILNISYGFSVGTFLDGQGVSQADRTSGFPIFPWREDAPDSENYAPLTIGQLKLVFSFNLVGVTGPMLDEDEDGLPDYWELSWFGILDRDGWGDYDGDGILDRFEYQAATDPTVDESHGGNGATRFTYDVLGRLSTVIGAVTLTYVFDDEGNLKSAN